MGAVKVDLGEVGGGGAGNLQQIIDAIYPVGCLYQSFVNTNPKALFGVGEWQQINGYFIRAANDTKTGGDDTVTLTVNQMPSHTHTIRSTPISQDANYTYAGTYRSNASAGGGWDIVTPATAATNQLYNNNTGGGQAHNNMPKYQNVYTWRRIA